MAKTIVVEVTRRVPHPVYKRIVSKRKKFYAHDEQGTAKVGDVVRIVECRPLEQAEALGVEGSGAQGGAGDHRPELHRHSDRAGEASFKKERQVTGGKPPVVG